MKLEFLKCKYEMERNVIGFVVLVAYCFSFLSAVNHERDYKRGFEEFRQFDKVCPKLWAQVKKSHIDEFAINCNHSLNEVAKSKELTQLKNLCLLVNAMLSVKCINVTNNDLPLDSFLHSPDATNICPIKLHLPENLNHSIFKNLTHLLANEGMCNQICFDLDHLEDQCSALLKVQALLSTPFTFSATQFPRKTNQPLKNQINSSSPPLLPNSHQAPTAPQSQNPINPSPVNETETFQEDITSNRPQDDPSPSHEYSNKGPSQSDPYQMQKSDQNQSPKDLPKEEDPDMANMDPLSNAKFLSGEDADSDQQVDQTRPNKEADEPAKDNTWNETPHRVEAANHIYIEESHFFFYFLMFSSVVVLGYFAFHNKNKILAYALEGRSERRSRRRPNPAKYRRLETNLEEAIGSSVGQQAAASTVVY